jgi:tRNA G10  N-methylase Trm11
MKLYAFQLGRIEDLCLAELKSVLGEENFVDSLSGMAIFKIEIKDPQDLQDRLGGTIKIIEIVSECSKDEVKDSIEKMMLDHFVDHQGKLPFAINLFGKKSAKNININNLLNFSKKFLTSYHHRPEKINRGTDNPKPGAIYQGKAIKKGIDINIIETESNFYIGKSISIQNIAAYSLRDYKKPKRDAKTGMTPPKLCQIMINLAGPTKTIYDPFCGTGSYLMEGIIMGKTAIGSDIEEWLVEYSDKNLYWTSRKFNTDSSYRLFTRDARFLTKELLPEKIDAVVTEGFLGKAFDKAPTKEEKEIELRKLANLHLNWLTAIHPLLPNEGKIVMCLTAYRGPASIEFFPKFQEIAETAGYRITDSFLYQRPDQLVLREIKVLEKIY